MDPFFQWVNSYRGWPVPSNAVSAGFDLDGSEIYVGRANYSGDKLPAKIIPRKNAAYVCYDGREIPVTEYKVLVGNRLYWQSNTGGTIPPGAIPGGRTSSGEPLYIGRKSIGSGAMTVGKVHPSHGCLYVPFDGKELSYKHYKILVYK